MKAPKILDQVPISEISHLKASANYTLLFDKENKEYVSAYSLKHFAQLLANQPFIRLDRSTLVRHSFIKKVGEANTVLLQNNQLISLPRRKVKVLNEELSQIA